MDNWFKSKWFVRFAALAFAVILYIFVDMSLQSSGADSTFPGKATETQTLEDFPVDVKIDEENYVVSGVPETVTVNLSGSTSKLRAVSTQRNFDVFVDLEGREEGSHVVEIQHTISNDLEAYIEPKTVEVYIEERASEEFRVSADFINQSQLPPGFELGEYEINPGKVTITSSRSVIDQIGVVKVFVDVAGLEDSINNREVPVNVYDSQGNELTVRIDPQTVEVSAEINNPSKQVSVNVPTVGELPDGYTLTSITPSVEEVEAFATTEVLEELNSISTEEIDLSEITETGTVEVGLSLPEGVNVPEVETIEVSIEIEEQSSEAEQNEETDEVVEQSSETEGTEGTEEQLSVTETIPIEVEGLTEGQAVSFVDPETDVVNFTLEGSEAEVGELTAEDFQAFINVQDLSSGEHTVPVQIEGPELAETTVTAEYEEVTINISDEET